MLEPTQAGVDQLLSLFHTRTAKYLGVHQGMKAVRDIYDNEYLVTIADMDKNEKSAVPNLLRQGVDQMAGRIASVVPQAFFASEKPGSRNADRRATTAARTVQGWWAADRLPLKMKKRARHLVAYGMAPAVVTYSKEYNRPCWSVRDPMTCFPSPNTGEGNYTPEDVIFSFRRPAKWLIDQGYGNVVAKVSGSSVDRILAEGPDTQYLLLEYVSPDCHGLAIAGSITPYGEGVFDPTGASRSDWLVWTPNPTGKMNAVVPSRLTLGKETGQFDAMIAMYYMQSRLMALEIAGVERGIYPDMWLTGKQGEPAQILDGPHDGRSGRINVAQGTVQYMDMQPGWKTDGMIDRIERSQRLTAGIPPEFGGESGTNIRTGRRGDQVLSGVIDFPVAEAQDVLAYAIQDEDEAAIALSKHYDGDTTRTIYVGTGNSTQKVTYIANQVFGHIEHTVQYPVSGADVNGLVMGQGQRVGMGTMSKQTAAEQDPWIADAELEHDRIIAEGLEQALMGGIQQQAAAGALPPLVVGKLMQLVRTDKKELAEALVQVTEEAQQAEAQAQQGPPMGAEAAMAPAAQAGLAGPSPIPGASPGQQSLSGLLTALRKPSMAVADRTGLTDPRTGRALV